MPTIAVIGASADRSKFGNRCVRAYLQRSWTVYPINPKERVIEGLLVYPSIRDVPEEFIDRVSMYLPTARGVVVLEEVAECNVGEVMLNPGADDPEVVSRGRQLGLNVVSACSLIAIGDY